METIAAVNAALALLEVLMPQVNDLFKKGLVTPEEQQLTRDKYLRLKLRADEMFSGPEWEIEPK